MTDRLWLRASAAQQLRVFGDLVLADLADRAARIATCQARLAELARPVPR